MSDPIEIGKASSLEEKLEEMGISPRLVEGPQMEVEVQASSSVVAGTVENSEQEEDTDVVLLEDINNLKMNDSNGDLSDGEIPVIVAEVGPPGGGEPNIVVEQPAGSAGVPGCAQDESRREDELLASDNEGDNLAGVADLFEPDDAWDMLYGDPPKYTAEEWKKIQDDFKKNTEEKMEEDDWDDNRMPVVEPVVPVSVNSDGPSTSRGPQRCMRNSQGCGRRFSQGPPRSFGYNRVGVGNGGCQSCKPCQNHGGRVVNPTIKKGKGHLQKCRLCMNAGIKVDLRHRADDCWMRRICRTLEGQPLCFRCRGPHLMRDCTMRGRGRGRGRGRK